MAAIALLALALTTAMVVAAAPLVVYAATLALFGFAHVVVELRYVRSRFDARLDPRLVVAWLALLALLVAARISALLHVALPFDRGALELSLLAALLLVTAFAAPAQRRVAALACTALVVGFGLVAPPAATLALLAFAHNLTPLGFLAERLRGGARRATLALALLAFVGVPLLLLAGGGDRLLEILSIPSSDGAFLAIGEVDDHFSAFLPPAWLAEEFAPRLFTAAVYLQCSHYFTVLHVLPRLASPAASASAPRSASSTVPRRVAFGGALAVVVGLALLVMFGQSFVEARRVYAIAAVVHAYVEWPLFLAVVVGAARAPLPTPSPA